MSLDNKPRNKGDPRSSHTSSPHNQQTQGPGKFMPSLTSPLVPTQLRILQWNCRSLTKRKNEFQLRLAQHRHSYDAILMQETNVKDPRLSAYNYFHNPAIERKYTKTGPPEARGLATVYLKGTVPHAQIDTQKWCTPDQEVTAVRTLIDNHKLILVSAYVRPTAEDPNFSWIEELRTVYPDDRMVIGGNFNAHHREWGYDDDDQRGARLLEAYEKAGLELANDTHEKTRVGTSANQQDTNPDLTLVDSRIEGMEWSVLPDAWGSDHYPIEISIRIKNRAKAKKTVVTVLWDKFRALLRAQIDENDMSTKLCALLVASTREASTKKEVNWDSPTPDTHLLSLWDHRTRKLTEYRKTKDRNTLKEVNRITAEAEEYARKLRVNEWLDHCASFDQRTSIRKLWRTFRGMLGITKVRNTIENMALALDKPLEDVLEDMGKAFFPQPSTTPNAAIYTLEQAPKDPPPWNTPITRWELETAIDQGRIKSAPGPDGITASMLRNLPEEGKQQVLRWFNHMWETDTFPDEWHESWVTPIPKAGKPPNTPKNTRPISLTSVMCKLFERIVLARITWIAEDRKLFHAAQTGFRQHLGTRDSLLLLSTDVYRKGSTCSLVAVDICKAFDLLPHGAIVKALREGGITHKPLNFVKGFLKQRKYSIKTGDICGPLRNNNIGVPQGAVISPILFNLTMAPLAWRLNKISTLKFTIYADDITIWTTSGNPARREQTLQKGLDTIEAFLKEAGLSPSPDKTRYMIFTRKGHPTHDLTFGGLPIAQAETHKILGVFFNQRKSPKEWLTRMAKIWKQGTALVRRIAQKTGGASEEVAKTLIRAVLASKVLYGANYYKLNKSHWRAIERWQNDARRTIAGLPRHTKLEELHRCVPLPKLQDLAKDQHELHLVSLQHTRQGRAILRLLRQDVSTLPKLGRPIPPWEIADVASSTPIPRNMGLDQPERRRDYAQKHLTVVTTKLEDPTTIVLYTDAAHKDLVTTTAWHDLRQNKSWSRETKTAGTPEEAEAQAILHALEHVTQSLNSPVKTVDIYTDAQEAIRRCRKHDPNSPTTRRILALARRLESKNVKTTVHWVPGHAGVPGNEAAHRSAEALATFLLSRPRSVDSLPGTSAYSGRTGPRKQDETRDRTLYDPEDAMRKVRQDLKKRLLASLPREPDPIPLGRYSRKKMVLLRRIRTGSAVTPHDRRKWELSAGKIGRYRPPVSTASPPASPPQPQQMQRQHSLEQPEICPYCKETLSANLHHLVWECGHFTNERKKALSLLPPASRPSNLEGWARPEGDSARIALILDSLLLYLENTGLESTF
ncbi:uncharacterized protein LOC115312129 [Ixodes scapularis]|uniref:uncharacterized protein LOC115312129 n=1 Tax=Ixodes scapularis TaxID=6945 RepID=UPI001AD7D1B2|nr:uncharacterized protein LOC115312129 [Ixodes scapularis]